MEGSSNAQLQAEVRDKGQPYEMNDAGLIDLGKTAALFKNRNTIDSEYTTKDFEPIEMTSQDRTTSGNKSKFFGAEQPSKPKNLLFNSIKEAKDQVERRSPRSS